MIRLTGFLILVVLAMLSCDGTKSAGGTGVGNPSPIEVAFRIELADADTLQVLARSVSARNVVIEDSAGTDFTVDSAALHFSRITVDTRFTDCPATICTEDFLRWTGTWVVDLVNRTSTPNLPTLELYPGYYRSIELRMDATHDETILSKGVSMLVSLSYTDSLRNNTLRLPLRFNSDVLFGDSTAPRLEQDGELVLYLLVEEWLNGVDVKSCLQSDTVPQIAEGVYELGPASCNSLVSRIKENIRTSVKIRL